MSEASTLNKLILLYLLDRASCPLSNAQIADFAATSEYLRYFQVQEILSELETSGLVTVKEDVHETLYSITEEGTQTINFFTSRLSEGIREDIRIYLRDNAKALRETTNLKARYFKTTSGEYEVHLEIFENNTQLFGLTVSVPSIEEAERYTLNWKDKAQEVYQKVMLELMS